MGRVNELVRNAMDATKHCVRGDVQLHTINSTSGLKWNVLLIRIKTSSVQRFPLMERRDEALFYVFLCG